MKAKIDLKEWIFDMADRIKMDPKIQREEDGSSRSAPCIPQSSNATGRDKRYVDITAMIRSLQRTEGFTDCFRRGIADCDQLECAWRQYCLGPGDI